MLPIFGGLAIWGLALWGLGGATRRFFFGELPHDEENAFTLDGLSGLFVLGIAGSLLGFLVPLAPPLSAAAAALGLGLAARRLATSWRLIAAPDVALAALGLALLAFAASGPVVLYDTGLYHQQAVLWATSGPLPLGLANLHRRFGLDSLWIPAAALLELPGLSLRSPSLAAPLVLFFFGAAVLSAARRCLTGQTSLSRTFLACAALACALPIADGSVPSLSTDLPVTLTTILSASFLLRWGSDRSPASARAAVVLALFAVTTKLSAAAWLVACVLAVRVLPIAATASLVVPWLARGIALSGCLLYPAVWSRLPGLPWTIPEATATAEVRGAVAWARHAGRPGLPEAGEAWIAGWLRATLSHPTVVPILALALLGTLLAIVTRKAPRGAGSSLAVAALVSGSSAAVWLLSAPDPRFGWASLFTLATLPLLLTLPALSPRVVRSIVVGVTAGSLALASYGLVKRGGQRLLRLPEVFAPPVVAVKTLDGATLYRPAGGDRCGASTLPCTPYPDERLLVVRSPTGRVRMLLYSRR